MRRFKRWIFNLLYCFLRKELKENFCVNCYYNLSVNDKVCYNGQWTIDCVYVNTDDELVIKAKRGYLK